MEANGDWASLPKERRTEGVRLTPISDRVARLISLVSNAPLVAFFTFLILLTQSGTRNFFPLLLVTGVFGTIIPLDLLYYLSTRGVISDMYAPQKETRVIPFLGSMVSYALGAVVLIAITAPPIIVGLMLCYFVNTLIMMLVSLRWKISVHASGIAGPITALIYNLGAIAVPSLLLLVPVGWARLQLRAHTISQVLVGALLTITVTWLQLKAYLTLL
jgi:membrane-associated phospholipid phosphatase